MRICVRLSPEWGCLEIPVHYNHILQSFVYRNLDKIIAERYHSTGYICGSRVYKLFTFSRLNADRVEYVAKSKTLRLFGIVSFKIGAWDSDLLESFAVHLLRKGYVNLGSTACRLYSIEVEKPVEFKGSVLVKAISPISVYRTFYDVEGKRKTIYYSPWDREFAELVADNLIRKARIVYGPDFNVELNKSFMEPVKVSERSLKVVIYKNYVIKGWLGVYRLTLPESLFRIAYNAGLGARNSMGFGMVEVVNG